MTNKTTYPKRKGGKPRISDEPLRVWTARLSEEDMITLHNLGGATWLRQQLRLVRERSRPLLADPPKPHAQPQPPRVMRRRLPGESS